MKIILEHMVIYEIAPRITMGHLPTPHAMQTEYLEIILLLKHSPCAIQPRKYRRSDHPLFRRRTRRNLPINREQR